MSLEFAKYTEISVNALKYNPKSQEVIDRKQEILQSIAQHYRTNPVSMLFVGFSPMMLAAGTSQISVTGITEDTKKYIDSLGIKYVYIDQKDLAKNAKKFSWVVASDEYFTFADSEETQRASVNLLTSLAKELVVTTLKDYKNQDFRDREFSQPLAVRNGKDVKLFVEHHDIDYSNKNLWQTTVYELEKQNSQAHGPFTRSSMYFKQLAKFSIDAGAKEFFVHKNLMYKSLIKKNYEHVISIAF